MSANEEPEAVEAEVDEGAGESEGMSERTAKLLLLTVLLLAMWGIIAAAPWVAYVVVGILLDRGWLKARDWQAQRGSSEEEAEAAESPAAGSLSLARELTIALHAVGAPHAHISALAEHLNAPAERVRDALDEVGIPRSGGVRMKGRKVAVSPGVKRGDFPPLPSPGQEGPMEGVLTSNNNSNNNFETVDDEANPARAHVRWHTK
jgi:hypothetical protein